MILTHPTFKNDADYIKKILSLSQFASAVGWSALVQQVNVRFGSLGN